ncbi:diguanylate cyclase/phosphodiesterase (GGDEF & EAL domains) with PAS/PAC sensor(s) [hydrothermal vent metagenome]|uniref:Diguanylate cyclase/phosphodiesterase (GGDEF & EAL domains) with PAS/PAC sensor(S) n=1 Tax=hydrothermal vent metagenome TaxID=652676 RepID=A0A3B0VT26_9ZZZZ
MSLKPYLIQPVKMYFTGLLAIGLLMLVLLIGNLYHQTQSIQVTLQQKTLELAKEEIELAVEESIISLTSNLLELAEWDEIRQQIEDPSYYYFWHEDRLKGSPYFKKNYTQLEIYNQKKWLLMPSIADNNSNTSLPLHIQDEEPTVIFSEKEAFLHMFEPVFERNSQSIQGYIGISVALHNFLLNEHEFTYANPDSIQFTGTKPTSLSDLSSYLHFEPVTNAVSDELWQLINNFTLYVIILLIILTILIIIIFQTLFSGPMQTLSSYVQQLKKNPKKNLPITREIFLIKEFEELKYSIHDYHRDLQTTQQALKTQYKIVWEQARRDPLTNIHNRRAFDEAWNELLASSEYHPSNVSFILFDCDFFKALNDTYGHEVGDDVIRISAKIIQKNLPSQYPVFRIGGDEFAVIIKKSPLHESFAIAKKCLKSLKHYNFSGIGIKEKLTFSVGISHLEHQMSKNLRGDLLNLPRQADIAMYKAKQSHQHKIQCYQSQLEQESLSLVSNQVINTIVEAIHTGQYINMHLQEIQSISNNALYYESLIRIQKEDLLIYPSDIFSIVERRRLEVEMDTQIIQQILHAFQKGFIPQKTGVSINISGKTLLQSDFVELFQPFIPYLKNYKIVIEIVENTLIDHMEYAKTVLNTLRQQGFLIALDDFGSGYSSIRYLAHMPVDIIKFDMSMTLALNADEKTKNIILSTAKMVRDSGYDLVLEGIETEEAFEQAKQAGATHVQGYLFGKPKSISRFNEAK